MRFDGKIKHAFANGSIDRRACDVDVVLFVPAVQLDFVWQLYAVNRSVVVVENLLFDASHRRRFLHDEVCLRIEEYLPLYSRRRGHLELQRVSAAHLRVPRKRQRDFVFLKVQQPGVVILRRRFQLHSFRAYQRAELAGGILMPCRLPVVRLYQVLIAGQQFRVVAVRQLGIQRVRPGFPVVARESPFEDQGLNPAERLTAAGSLHVLLHNLARLLLRAGRTHPRSENQNDECNKQTCTHEIQL